ncbi:replication initiator protein A [Asticcacaulis tiandongensis]|uniref:replication initiator protein A n=1 Tax=Asticcacaulis tiandongensis TaxID=2565365 RepID=UPI00112D17EE|nr:replication initiator protein A [Asticcacaulis tiandongensis]
MTKRKSKAEPELQLFSNEGSETVDVGRSPLLPERRETDLFVCDIMDAVPKADMPSMEHPVFSLSTKPDTRVRRYEHHDAFVEITPSVKGIATVHDRDILIYCISQTIAALNQGRPVSQHISMKAWDFLKATNRTTSGEGYEGLKAALERLAGTRISTNVKTGGDETFETFGLIESAKIVRETREGRMQEVSIKLSDWVYRAIQAKEVLTLHPDYFRLRKPLERRMYELARKHCGRQPKWVISLELLQKKCGSNSTLREFKRLVRTIVTQDEQHNHMPDYSVTIESDNVVFINRMNRKALKAPGTSTSKVDEPHISPETFTKARRAAPGYDVQALFHEWVNWWKETGKPDLKSPDAAFISFCKHRHERSPIRR